MVELSVAESKLDNDYKQANIITMFGMACLAFGLITEAQEDEMWQSNFLPVAHGIP